MFSTEKNLTNKTFIPEEYINTETDQLQYLPHLLQPGNEITGISNNPS